MPHTLGRARIQVIGAVLICLASTVDAAPTLNFIPGSTFDARCAEATGPTSNVNVIPIGLDPARKYEIYVTRDFFARSGGEKIEASASINTGRIQRSSYLLDSIWPGEYDVVLVDKSTSLKFRPNMRGTVVASARLNISPPRSEFSFPQNLNPGQPFTIIVRSGAGPNRKGAISFQVSKSASSGASGSFVHLRIANISPCSKTEIPMKGLPAGRYEARLLQSSYGAGDTMLHETTIVVGRSAEAARADVSPPITAKTSKATTASATEPRESGAKWDAASAGLVKIDPFTNRANATLVQQQGAKDYWVYAALSNNVYVPDSDNSFIKLPKGWEKYNSKSLDFGFYAETHVHRVNGQIVEVVVVFRGTQEWSDWWNANFSPLTSPQEALAKSYAQTIMGLEDLAGAKFTATGHSLGGALAKAAVNGTDKIAIVFNSSPRGPDGSNVRYIEETGDILDALRVNRGGEIAFNFSEVSAKESHAIYPLANGLRKLAE